MCVRVSLYIAYYKVRARHDPIQTIPTGSLPAPLDAVASALNDGVVAAVNNGKTDQHTISAGLRLDVVRNVDFKLQLDRISIDNRASPGHFTNVGPGFDSGKDVNVFSFVIDVVF